MTRITETKEIAVYGAYKRRIEPHRERRLATRKDGIRQHYWYGHKKPRLSETPEKGRYEFSSNNNRELYRAMVKAHTYMPRVSPKTRQEITKNCLSRRFTRQSNQAFS